MADRLPDSWPRELQSYWIESASVLSCESHEEEKPGRDSLGNPGRVHVVRHTGRLGVALPRGQIVERLEGAGLRPVRDTAEETELARPRAAQTSVDTDPFLLERTVAVTVRGRDFPGAQRALVETKVEKLRRESQDGSTSAERRTAAAKLLADLESGLRTTLDVRTVERRFRPSVALREPVESIGRVVPVRAGSRIVYSVAPVVPEKGDDAEAEPMVFHLVGLGAREAVMLYTGGVHGQRHLRDLEASPVHHAWFANRERVKTEATAPWISRRLFRDLTSVGSGEIVVHKRRDVQPVSVEKTGEGRHVVQVDGKPLEVPVILCRTLRDDELTILDDAESPLVLRLVEAGAEIVRTIDAIHSEPLHPFALPTDASAPTETVGVE